MPIIPPVEVPAIRSKYDPIGRSRCCSSSARKAAGNVPRMPPPRQYTGGGASFAPAVRLLLPMAPPHVWASRFRPRHSRPSQRSPTGPLPPVAATASPVRACDSSFPLRTRRPCALSFRALLRTSQTVGLSWDHCAVPVFHHISTCRHASSTTYMLGSFFALSMEAFDIICLIMEDELDAAPAAFL